MTVAVSAGLFGLVEDTAAEPTTIDDSVAGSGTVTLDSGESHLAAVSSGDATAVDQTGSLSALATRTG